jgi:magnesium-transporting ATPase (P-type)
MITGDQAKTAQTIAQVMGITSTAMVPTDDNFATIIAPNHGCASRVWPS